MHSNSSNMDPKEGQLFDLQASSALGNDLLSSGLLERTKRRPGILHKSSSLSIFWASEEDEIESAPRGMKQKWKKIMQTRSTDMSSSSTLDAADQAVDGAESRWQDLPMEVLMRILELVEFRTVVLASGVCTSWRDSICLGATELSFSWCGRSVSKLVQSVAPKFTSLECCTIKRCDLLNDQAIEAIGSNWHSLRALDLTKGARLTDSSLLSLANGCPQLEMLDLSGCIGFSESGLVILAQHCKNLQYLNLCGCNNAGSNIALQALAQNCSQLQLLNVGWCELITDAGVTALAVGCPDLRVVDFCGCLRITDQSVIVLAENCLHLRVLGLYGCERITDVAMYSLVNHKNCRTSAMRSNKHSASSGNSTGDVWWSQYYSRARKCKSVSSAMAYSSVQRSCGNSGDASNPTFLKGCFDSLFPGDPAGYGLMSLNLSGCKALSAQAVQAVCNAFPELHTCPERYSLNMSGCLNLTSVHCVCGDEARRERLHQADYAARQPAIPRPPRLSH